MADNIYEEVEADALGDELRRVLLFGKPVTVVANLSMRDHQRYPNESVATATKRNEVFLKEGISHDCLACPHMKQESECYCNVERDCMAVQTVIHCGAKACVKEIKMPLANLCSEVILPPPFVNAAEAGKRFGEALNAFSKVAGMALPADEPDLPAGDDEDDELDRLSELLDDRSHSDAYGTW